MSHLQLIAVLTLTGGRRISLNFALALIASSSAWLFAVLVRVAPSLYRSALIYLSEPWTPFGVVFCCGANGLVAVV